MSSRGASLRKSGPSLRAWRSVGHSRETAKLGLALRCDRFCSLRAFTFSWKPRHNGKCNDCACDEGSWKFDSSSFVRRLEATLRFGPRPPTDPSADAGDELGSSEISREESGPHVFLVVQEFLTGPICTLLILFLELNNW